MLALFIMLMLWQISKGDKCTEWKKGPESACYKFCLNPTPFHIAEHECQKYGGHLVSLHDRSENNFVFGFVQKEGAGALKYGTQSVSPPVWLGLVKNGKTSSWKWTDGTNLDYFECRECSYLAQMDESKSCAYMETSRLAYQNGWFLKLCSRMMPFVCKKNRC